MTEQLPAQWALDMAAKAAGYRDWIVAQSEYFPRGANSIIAPTRTLERLAKYEPELVPVDPDAEELRRILADWTPHAAATMVVAKEYPEWPEALAEYKRVKANG